MGTQKKSIPNGRLPNRKKTVPVRELRKIGIMFSFEFNYAFQHTKKGSVRRVSPPLLFARKICIDLPSGL